ncbi:MAG: primase-helicase family protein [Rhodopila sp.]
MRGGEGTGKGTLAKVLRHIFGQHGMAISNSKHLTGNFNGHLRDCVFLFADEAFYAGDPSHVGVLKSIITEPHLTIEAKFANPVQMPNFLHLMMASNEEWVVPASLDARRFLVLEVSDTRANDHAYFSEIWAEMDAGGYEAMLHELLNIDLTRFNVRRVPVTDGLQQQKKLSLGTSEAWWCDVLHRGYVYKSKLGLDDFFGEWHGAMTTEVLHASYSEYAKSRNERHLMAREAFGKFMVRMGATPVRPRNAVIGEHIPNPHEFGVPRRATLITRPRATGYALGTLAQARAAFTAKTGLAQVWPTDDAPEEAP